MKLLTVIHNATTGEIIEREMNDEEIAQFNKDIKDAAKRKEEAEAAKAAAETKLAALGLTADDLKALGL